MQIVKKSVDDIKPNKYNPNKIPEEIYKTLVSNIKKFGYLQPILIDKDGVIIDGEHRWRACKEIGINEVECVIYNGNGDIKEYRKLLTLAMNNIRGENQDEEFEALIKDLAYGMDYEDIESITGFDANMIDEIIKKNNADNFGTDFELPEGENDFQQMTFILSNRQVGIVKIAIDKARSIKYKAADNENSNGNALELICKNYG
jgi:hypothetical protein